MGRFDGALAAGILALAMGAVADGGDLVVPVAARSEGLAGTVWRTALTLAAGDGAGGTAFVEWYPPGAQGPGPAVVGEIQVPASGQVTVEDLVGDLFGFNGTGAVILRADFPLAGTARIFNDRTAQPADGGTFGQGMPAMPPGEAPVSGLLLGLSQQPVSQQAGFRTNIGFFNPGDTEVVLTVEALSGDGEPLGSVTFPVAAREFWQGAAFDLVSSVPQEMREQRSFLVRFTTQGGGLFCYASVVDNVTGDATTILPVNPAP